MNRLLVYLNLRVRPEDVPDLLTKAGYQVLESRATTCEESVPEESEHMAWIVVVCEPEPKGCETFPGFCHDCDQFFPAQGVARVVGKVEGTFPRYVLDWDFDEEGDASCP